MPTETRVARPIILLGTLVALVLVVGIGLAYFTGAKWQALNVMLGLVAIISFFGVLGMPGGWSEGAGFSEGRVRFALTSALVMLYVVYFSTVIFWFNVPEAKLDELPKEMIGTLADLLKIVVPFYFGATAATEVIKYRQRASSTESKT